MEKLTLKELVILLEQELICIGYKDATLNYYRENWKRIITYFDRQKKTLSVSLRHMIDASKTSPQRI